MGNIADSLNNFWKIGVHPIKTDTDSLKGQMSSATERISTLEEEISGGGGSGIELADVTGVTVTAGHGRVYLKWTDPADVTLDGATLARWLGTKILRKEGSAPDNETDGTVVLDSKSRGAYVSTPFEDSGLTDGTTYYYRFFPYTTTKTYTAGTVVNATPVRASITKPTVSVNPTYQAGVSQSPTLSGYDADTMTLGGDQSAENAGSYNLTVTPKPDYQWDSGDDRTAAITLAWSIGKADNVVSLNPASLTLNTSATSGSVAVSRLGDGAISAVSNDTSIATVGTISGNTVPVNSVNGKSGSTTIKINVAEGTNYKAASINLPVTAKFYSTMTVKLDLTNSDPSKWATYADDAATMTAGNAAWDDFFGHYPVMLLNGVEGKKLNPNDYTKHEDGTAADITSGSEGDVTIKFPRRGLKITKANSVVTISMTDNPDDSSFGYYAHKLGSDDCDEFYLGAYKGFEQSSKLRSLSGKTVTANKTIGAFRTLAQANGSGYDQSGFYQLVFRQAMYVLKYKGQNAQIAVGRGYVDGNSNYATTGGTNTKGMDYGETTGKVQMCLFGLEDFFGNYYEWIDGIFSDASRNILTATSNFNDTGSGYTNRGSSGFTSDTGGWMQEPIGTTEAGFVPQGGKVSGSETTYFCDYTYVYASQLAGFGGNRADGSDAGAFHLIVNSSASRAYAYIAARLMFRKKRAA